ncbi:hypothetical protein DVH24_014049 [Malus domestica]|uniref:Uncharacterized protein n=1 Tax=Malus domestica TaxID=3750 RepID=A0A498JI84_MALDO|nr:hypothetical protein DVH24_014049 [Malus domestica]
MGRDRMRTERNGEGAKMPSDGNKEEKEGDEDVIILYSTSFGMQTGHDKMEWDETGWGRNGKGVKMLLDGNKEKEE